MKAALDGKKSYPNIKIMHREFRVRYPVYLRVKLKKSSLNLGDCAKLAPRYCGHFEVFGRIGPVAYRIAFPANMRTQKFFHVSLLKKYVHDANHIIGWNVIQVEPEGEIQVDVVHILEKMVTLI